MNEDKNIEQLQCSAPSLRFTLEADGRRWQDVDVCGLVEALNSILVTHSVDVLLDAISPAVWQERRAAFTQDGLSGVISNASSLPETISSDVISIMSEKPGGKLKMEILETVLPGGAAQLGEELSRVLKMPLLLEATRTEDTAVQAFEKTQKTRRRLDAIFDAVLIFTGACCAFAALAGYIAPGTMFVLAGILRAAALKSPSSAFIAMPEGKISASYILSMFETEARFSAGDERSIAKYVYLIMHRESALVIIMIAMLGIALMMFLAAAPAVFQALFGDAGIISNMFFAAPSSQSLFG